MYTKYYGIAAEDLTGPDYFYIGVSEISIKVNFL